MTRPGTGPAPNPSQVAAGARDGHRYVFVCGLHRSGTSLLVRCLREHPEISTFQDTGVPEDEGQHLQDVYPTARALGGPGRFGFDPNSHMTETSPLMSDHSRDALNQSWGRYWDLSKPVLLEKSPPNLVRTRFLQALFPESAFLIITRHPVAVACATRKWNPAAISVHVRHWLTCHETFAADAPHLARKLVLRYEDLVARPGPLLERVYAFLELKPVPCNVPIAAGLNERYIGQWNRGVRGAVARLSLRVTGRRLEARIRRFGYSLREG